MHWCKSIASEQMLVMHNAPTFTVANSFERRWPGPMRWVCPCWPTMLIFDGWASWVCVPVDLITLYLIRTEIVPNALQFHGVWIAGFRCSIDVQASVLLCGDDNSSISCKFCLCCYATIVLMVTVSPNRFPSSLLAQLSSNNGNALYLGGCSPYRE